MKDKKVVYEFNPYTFARISAMKSLLLQKEDYDRIMKMGPNEIIKFLQDGVYSQEINELGIRYSGITLVERALNKHIIRVFSKLRMICDPNLQHLMDQYLKRYDFLNIKTILRAKQTDASDEETVDMLLPAGSLKMEKLKEMMSKGTTRSILETSRLVDMSGFKEAIERYENSKELTEIENLLDYHYYVDSGEFAEKIPKQGKLFREFFMYEFDIYNLKILLKKLFFDLEKEDIERYLVPRGRYLNRRIREILLNADSIEKFVREISKTPYRNVIVEIEEGDALLKYEVLLERFLLEKSILLFHQHPLTVDIVLGYMFAKEIEVRNLRTIIKSKKFEFAEDYVKELIVIR